MPNLNVDGITRRSFLQVGSFGLAGLGIPRSIRTASTNPLRLSIDPVIVDSAKVLGVDPNELADSLDKLKNGQFKAVSIPVYDDSSNIFELYRRDPVGLPNRKGVMDLDFNENKYKPDYRLAKQSMRKLEVLLGREPSFNMFQNLWVPILSYISSDAVHHKLNDYYASKAGYGPWLVTPNLETRDIDPTNLKNIGAVGRGLILLRDSIDPDEYLAAYKKTSASCLYEPRVPSEMFEAFHLMDARQYGGSNNIH